MFFGRWGYYEYKLENQKPYEVVNSVDKLIDILEDQHEPTVNGRVYYYYKKVNSSDDPKVFTSYHKPEFKYVVGEHVQDSNHGVYLYKSRTKAEKHVGGNSIIKLSSSEKLELESDWGSGKYRTKGKLKVESVEDIREEQF